MNQRIIPIKGCKTCKSVLIFLDRNESGEEFVRLIAWHNTKDGDMIQCAEMDFCKSGADSLMNKRIIADFSEFSANEFANSFQP
jgi:hypothetical protein